MKLYTFYLHYNKPASLAAKAPKMSVHFRDRCLIVDSIKCFRPTHSKVRARQPRIVMAGSANTVRVYDGVAVID